MLICYYDYMNEIHTPELQQLLVTRNGSLDHDHYAAIRRDELKQTLHELGGKALRSALHAPVVVGRGLVWLAMHEGQNDYRLAR